jgi:hypothetical protein
MADPVKISALPAISSVQPNDIIPIVDSALTQTSKATAAQIAGIGGGPPGDNTVTSGKIANGAVLAAKLGFTATDKIVGRATAGAGNGEEITCTAYARGLLASADATAAQLYLNALQSTNNPTFTGQVKFADGTEAAPSITNTGNTNTGIFFPQQNTVGIALEGQEFVRFLSDGTTLSRTYTSTNASVLLPQFSVRAWVVLDGTVGNTYVINNQHLIAARYGLPGQSLYYDAATVARISALEVAYGNSVIATSTTAYDGRTNYTSPGDNIHYRWNGAAWVSTGSPAPNPWIGSITLRSSATNTVKSGGNVTSITDVRNTSNVVVAGTYQINFATPMPDTSYAVLITSKRSGSWADGGDQTGAKTTTSAIVQHVQGSAATDTSEMNVIIVR